MKFLLTFTALALSSAVFAAPPGCRADAAGCAAYDPATVKLFGGWLSCCMNENHRCAWLPMGSRNAAVFGTLPACWKGRTCERWQCARHDAIAPTIRL